MALRFERIAEHDLPELARVMQRAFDDDAQKHLGVQGGGPPGYDDGKFFRRWLFGRDETVGCKILEGDQLVGAFIVWIHDHGDNLLGTLFVDPDHQDRGVGRRAWQFIESRWPTTRSWSLGTPSWAVKNHYFYESTCGFVRVAEDDDGVRYRKVMT